MLSYNASAVPQDIRALLESLAQQYDISPAASDGAIEMSFESGTGQGQLEVTLAGNKATIRYDAVPTAARGIGALLAGLVKQGEPYREQCAFTTFGIMLDCSRNAVMTVEHFKKWLRQLALMGYSMAMLYTEDTYEIPGRDYFGYLRGRYSSEDLAEVDRYAATLGIEMIGCIQTLGHCGQILHWSAFSKVKDTSTVMLVDEEETYKLIDEMIGQYARCYTSRRIHVGMDEAHDMGRGRFLDRFGYERPFDIFNRHLDKVVKICEKHGLAPMIWSDMFFRMAHPTGSYTQKDKGQVPPDVAAAIPKAAQLVYWDYYNASQDHYESWFKDHRDLGFEPVMAGGVWTWARQFWYGRHETELYAPPCIAACRNKGVKEYIATLWGDDGAFCEYDSALAGLALTAELAWVGDEIDPQMLAARFEAICGASYQAMLDAAEVNAPYAPATASAALWDDPLQGVYWKTIEREVWQKAAEHYGQVVAKLQPHSQTAEPVDLAHGFNVARALKETVEIKLALDEAYQGRDAKKLQAVRDRIATMVELLDELLTSFRRQWYRRNRTQGFEVIQIRLGGLKQRWLEAALRIGELLAGEIEAIDELDERPASPRNERGEWRSVAAGTVNL
jgi:cation transport regulator ChaB